MIVRPPSDWLRRWLLPALFLVVLYGVFRQPTWSADGCAHTLESVHFMDDHSYSHFLLRPVVYLWVALCKQAGLATHAQWYAALNLLFAGMGVAALTMLFGVARRRVGEGPAWACLVAIAFARDAMRQLTVMDEKGLGMFLFALAVVTTERLFRQMDSPSPGPLRFRAVLPTATAWVIAVFGHLQNAPFAAAFLVALVVFLPRAKTPVSRRAGLAALAGLYMTLIASVLFVALHWRLGRLATLPMFLHDLFNGRPAPPPAADLVGLWLNALQGWTKAFFIVDRLSPKILVGLAVVGIVLLAVAAAWGVARRRDGLAGMLLVGSLSLLLLMPLANSFPGYGDSYTVLILGAMVLLVTAPRRLLLAGTALVVLVNLPAAISFAHPSLTIQRHLAAMVEIQNARDARWIILDELAGFPGEQELTPAYYPMKAGLRFSRSGFDRLPPGRCLVDLPLLIERSGAADTSRLGAIQEEFERRGRRVSRAQLWDPLRIIRSDFHVYGNYLIVDPTRQ